tara:strand:- start:1 stop:357 length:357 start_codon:yes stop_codon:yes gene_type:complete
MPKVYRKIVTGQFDDGQLWSHSTNMFTCESCLNENNVPRVEWVGRYVEDIVPGPGNPGVYVEAPLETCDRCFQKDDQAHEEMHQWCEELDNQQWEEQEYPIDHSEASMKGSGSWGYGT